jgi:peptidoglycan hydrolase-like protein with peptidoglycan-binding domain
MRIIRSFIAPAAALAVASGIAVLPALASAPPASAAVSCTGTSLVTANAGDLIRIPTVGNGTGNDNCQLGLGNDSVAVARLQIALDSPCNFSAGLAVDNDYGPLTQAAVEHAQSEYGITVDGIYGPQTRNALWWPVAGTNGGVCEQL